MNKIMVVVSVLVLATAGYAASYTTDFEAGTLDGWTVGGARWALIDDDGGVGGTKALDAARTDGPSIYLLANWWAVGGVLNFTDNLQTKYGDQFHISFAMKDGDDGSPDLVTLDLENAWIDANWTRTWSTPLSEAGFTTYDTGLMDATWSDAAAIAAGWTKVGGASFASTVTAIHDLTLHTDGPGINFEWPLIDRSWTDNITIETYVSALLGDANHDGLVSADDYASVQANFGNTSGGMSAVPEPATLGLLAIGLIAVLRKRSR